MPEALKSRVSVPGSPTVVLYVFAVGFTGHDKEYGFYAE